ncbi:HERC5 [Symbiodinium natans]|uniref:HERC5 protein n=1 Tax=Symbiodinium natans TaxID=878477 RepID=A0A812N1S3_9DINO|nr:HERC5 [Symbiodinium natans]
MAAEARAATPPAEVVETLREMQDLFEKEKLDPDYSIPSPSVPSHKAVESKPSPPTPCRGQDPPQAWQETRKRVDFLASSARAPAACSRGYGLQPSPGPLRRGSPKPGPPLLSLLPEDLVLQIFVTGLEAASLASLAQTSRKIQAFTMIAAADRMEEGTPTTLRRGRLREKLESCRKHAGSSLAALRRMRLREKMDTLLCPTMGVSSQPVVLARGAGHQFLDWSFAGGADEVGRLFAGAGTSPVAFGNSCPQFSVSAETMLLSPHGSLPDPTVRIVSVACGKDHLLLLDSSGRPWALGDPCAGGVACSDQLSHEVSQCAEFFRIPNAECPAALTRATPVMALWSVHLTKVACGSGHSVALSRSGDVFAFGRALARPDLETLGSTTWRRPRKVPISGMEDVAAGDSHVAAVCRLGDTYLWGENVHGQCARDPVTSGEARGSRHRNSEAPHLVPSPARAEFALAALDARRAACGRYHTAVLSSCGRLVTFGDGLSGQLGRAAAPGEGWKPAELDLVGTVEERVVQVACGDDHTVCLTEMGQVLAFGSGEQGQLCMGGCRNYRLPTLIRPLADVREIVAGANWTMLRCADEKVFLAGRLVPRGGRRPDGQEEVCEVDQDHRLLRQIVAPASF